MIAPPPSFVVFGRTPFDRGLHVWHHIARRLARSHRVVYVQDPVRIGLTSFPPRPARLQDGLVNLVPLDFPLQRFAPFRSACMKSLRRAVRRGLGPDDRPLVCILYPRSSVESALALEPDLIVYHATDDFSYTWEGQDDTRFLGWERRALSVAGLVVATQEALAERFRKAGHPSVMVQTLGFDELVFDGRPRPVPPELQGLPRPILGYAGNLYASKIDTQLVNDTATAKPHWTFVFVGESFDDAGGTLARMAALPNVRVLGSRPFEEVPAYVGAFDVAIHPQRRDPRGREFNFYALKVFDALAMGRAIVLTPKSSLRRLSPHASYAEDVDSFNMLIESALAAGNGPVIARARRDAVAGESWTRKVEEFVSAVHVALTGGEPNSSTELEAGPRP